MKQKNGHFQADDLTLLAEERKTRKYRVVKFYAWTIAAIIALAIAIYVLVQTDVLAG